MKKFMIFILMLASMCLRAENRVSERVFVKTDRPVYLAGDKLWCSAFCVDAASSGKLSEVSSIAYVELHSMDGLAQTAKIALLHGRGAGSLELKSDLPTGNYRLVAYTANSLNEDGVDYSSCATTISIFNPTSTTRVKDGVKVSDPKSLPVVSDKGTLEVKVAENATGRVLPVEIHNNGKALAAVCISIAHDDGIVAPQSHDIDSFLSSIKPSSSFSGEFIPEYDGEIIRAKVSGISPEQADSLAGKFAFISAPGDMADVYSSPVASDATATFYTNNIFGDKDLVCEIEGLPKKTYCHLEILSPFQDVQVGNIPELVISNVQKNALLARLQYRQIENNFEGDFLYDLMPFRANRIFGSEAKSYKLDDYTRFPLMSEVLVEIIPELRARTSKGRTEIQFRMEDQYRNVAFTQSEGLVLLDGTPIFDHDKIMSYDPMLVETVNVYPYTYFIGSRAYHGVADFVTYKKNLPSMDFDTNVRIVSFQGASLPMSFTGENLHENESYPDYRQVAYWHPAVSVEAGETFSFECTLPSYEGDFILTVEGLTEDGKPVRVVRKVTSSARSKR
ncbi:MAG: hypothetical protein MJZ09_03575 [Bacteroidales bacterium]|nr:hypothetical protein [Bacteroidales bacterium]